ncbi:peptidase S24/S26A/S26B/S26C [Chytriomyces sp. MP71]|nr:peptidase S24/S26A/S26B/S26C [Chytriomyces sp. MP71]
MAAKRILFSAAPLLCVNEFLYSVTPINGKSMTPTLNPDTLAHNQRDWVLLDKVTVANAKLRRGDVVTFTAPHNPDMTLVKRIVALEGDVVFTRPHQPPSVLRVPRGFCWVESDESYHGIDSNVFGPIPMGLIEGKAACIVWPPKRIGPVGPGRLRKGIEHSGSVAKYLYGNEWSSLDEEEWKRENENR